MSPIHVTIPCPITVLLIRHAERAELPPLDPPLTSAGERRARELRRVAERSGVQAIFTTQFTRSVQTARPLAEELGISPVVLNLDANDPQAYVQNLVALIRQLPARSVALVVSHTTTIPMIGAALGAPAIATIENQEFDRLLIIQVPWRGAKARLIEARYGAR